jgi:hypothetical protein
MSTLTETLVSFETAKLAKKKGFNGKTLYAWANVKKEKKAVYGDLLSTI